MVLYICIVNKSTYNKQLNTWRCVANLETYKRCVSHRTHGSWAPLHTQTAHAANNAVKATSVRNLLVVIAEQRRRVRLLEQIITCPQRTGAQNIATTIGLRSARALGNRSYYVANWDVQIVWCVPLAAVRNYAAPWHGRKILRITNYG